MNPKESLYKHCLQYVQQRINRIKDEIHQAQASANEETKSTVGDKYETGRAMAQLEIEMNTRQLVEAEKLMASLRALSHHTIGNTVTSGSLVTTSNGLFYIAISIGATTLDQTTFYIVSPDSPAGKLLMGKKKGDTINWNGKSYLIQEIG